MSFKLKEKDNGLNKFIEGMDSLKGLVAKIGIQASDGQKQHEGSDYSIAEVAAAHEYGAPVMRAGSVVGQIPMRSFLRSVYDADPKRWENRLREEMAMVIKKRGSNYRQALRIVAEEMRTAIIDRINEGIPPPLAASTIARKGESTPLVDTGTMRGAIRAVVERVK